MRREFGRVGGAGFKILLIMYFLAYVLFFIGALASAYFGLRIAGLISSDFWEGVRQAGIFLLAMFFALAALGIMIYALGGAMTMVVRFGVARLPVLQARQERLNFLQLLEDELSSGGFTDERDQQLRDKLWKLRREWKL